MIYIECDEKVIIRAAYHGGPARARGHDPLRPLARGGWNRGMVVGIGHAGWDRAAWAVMEHSTGLKRNVDEVGCLLASFRKHRARPVPTPAASRTCSVPRRGRSAGMRPTWDISSNAFRGSPLWVVAGTRVASSEFPPRVGVSSARGGTTATMCGSSVSRVEQGWPCHMI